MRPKNAPQKAPPPPPLVELIEKCRSCQQDMNKGIRCKDCGNEHCHRCAGLTVEVCEMLRATGKDFYCCKNCESKSADLKLVLKSIENLTTDVKTIKDGQEEQQVEREKVIEGLKVVETVVKRIEAIETIQADHTERLEKNELDTKRNEENVEKNSNKIDSIEERLSKIEAGASNVRVTNAVVKEIREIEKREKNIMVWNVPELTEGDEEEKRKREEKEVDNILKELQLTDIKYVNVSRAGIKGGRYPRGVQVVLAKTEECQRVMKKLENLTAPLKTDVVITRDRTFNQREEAHQYQLQREREIKEGVAPQRGGGRGRGRGQGPGRPKGSGLGLNRGRGRGARSQSRKRPHDDDQDESEKRRCPNGTMRGATNATPRHTHTPNVAASTSASTSAPIPIPTPNHDDTILDRDTPDAGRLGMPVLTPSSTPAVAASKSDF